MNRARLRILSEAADEGFLWDVRLPGRDYQGDGTIRLRPAISVDELRPELELLLREKRVVLTCAAASEGSPLPLEEALAVVAEERSWYSPLAVGSDERREPSEIFYLALTNVGYGEFRAAVVVPEA